MEVLRETLIFTVALMLIVILSVFCVGSVYAISQPRYLEYIHLKPSLITIYKGDLIVYDLSVRDFVSVDISSGLVKSLGISIEPVKVAVSEDRMFFISHMSSKLYMYFHGKLIEIGLASNPNDIEVYDGLLAVSLPDLDVIEIYDVETLEKKYFFEVDLAYGLGKISIYGRNFWAVSSDGYTLIKIDLESGARSSIKLDERVMVIKAFKEGVIVATEKDKIQKISSNMIIEKKWQLRNGSTIDIGLYVIEDGRRIIYTARSRWVIGEIEEEVYEVYVNGRIFGDVLSSDRLWFIDTTNMRIGWVWLSRPPRITEFEIKPAGEGSFKALARVFDPDNDLKNVTLIVTVKSKIPGLPGDERYYPMDKLGEENLYVASFNLKSNEEVEVNVVAYDLAENMGVSEKIPLVYKEEKTKTANVTKTEEQPAIELTDIYMIASSLLLLIPIIIAILAIRIRRKTKKKHLKKQK
ncbi:MAG: hypothetical protein QXH49_03715 [Nitrososphaerota archaeon]